MRWADSAINRQFVTVTNWRFAAAMNREGAPAGVRVNHRSPPDRRGNTMTGYTFSCRTHSTRAGKLDDGSAAARQVSPRKPEGRRSTSRAVVVSPVQIYADKPHYVKLEMQWSGSESELGQSPASSWPDWHTTFRRLRCQVHIEGCETCPVAQCDVKNATVR